MNDLVLSWTEQDEIDKHSPLRLLWLGGYVYVLSLGLSFLLEEFLGISWPAWLVSQEDTLSEYQHNFYLTPLIIAKYI